MIDEKMKMMISEYALNYAKALILYGVDISNKYETATAMSLALENAYLRGRSDGLKYAYERQSKVGGWIPCSERLPNTNGVYSVTRKLVDGEHKFYISDSAYFDGQDTWHADNRVNHGREYLKDVIAWMPLQEPYKGD